MTAITISESAYDALWDETNAVSQTLDPTDSLDTLFKVPAELGQGFRREIEWREGLHLSIDDYQLHGDLKRRFEEHEHPIQMGFLLLGHCRSREIDEASAGMNWLCGSGLAVGGLYEVFAQRLVEVNIHIAPSIYQAFVANPEGEIPESFEHLFRELEQAYFYRYGVVTSEMQLALRQLLGCPFQGATKRMYLESKILELLALMTAQEQSRMIAAPLQMDEVDRIHEARKILLQRINQPPSLIELARLVGLNDNALKRGFRRVFGTTVFGYLHDYRLEQAQQLLASGEMKVTEVAAAIGFESRSYFSIAFRKKFGMNPKEYQLHCKRIGRSHEANRCLNA
ncbi:helix-turn-helix domain-containing protein [Leptolyngbya sp. AN03gr2]|uniref:helix-turn-helix transcriptional regulator n=1 Tax=unclassified Leptolyngbya TaxID=2650499 RepID=UPI003D3149BF